MTNAFILLLGLALGVRQTRRLRQAAVRVLGRARPAPWLLGAGLVQRLLLFGLVVGLLLAWSPAAALAALGGYWLGRTVVLALDLVQASAGRK
jgi:hypothetical protein